MPTGEGLPRLQPGLREARRGGPSPGSARAASRITGGPHTCPAPRAGLGPLGHLSLSSPCPCLRSGLHEEPPSPGNLLSKRSCASLDTCISQAGRGTPWHTSRSVPRPLADRPSQSPPLPLGHRAVLATPYTHPPSVTQDPPLLEPGRVHRYLVPWEDGEAARGGRMWGLEGRGGAGWPAGKQERRGWGWRRVRPGAQSWRVSAVDPKSKLPSSFATEAVGANRNCDLRAPPGRRGLQREGRSHG